MFAIIETGSKQYKVAVGDKIKVEKLESDKDTLSFDKVLLVSGGEGEKPDTKIGKPYLEGATVEAKLVKQGRLKKILVFKFHSKARYKKTKGHRQPFTEIEITKITA